jgi:hypothetical protein
MADDLKSHERSQMICAETEIEAGRSRAEVASQIGASLADLGTKLAELPKGQSYRVILSSPAGGGLNLRPDGLYDAFVKAPDGKFTSVARLQRIGPRFLTSASMLAGHAMLAQISSQLSVIQADVDLLVRQPVVTQLGVVKAQIISLRTLHHYSRHREQVLLDIIKSLKSSIGATVEYASELIKAVPEPPQTDVRRTFWDTSADTVKALDRAKEAVGVVMVALQALGEAEVLLNENTAAAHIMHEWIAHARRDLDFARCERLARMMPANADKDRHEVFWMRAASGLEQSADHLRKLLDEETLLQISLNCSLDDLTRATE